MRVLWNCNVAPNMIACGLGQKSAVSGGWLDSVCSTVANAPEVRFTVVIPGQFGNTSTQRQEIKPNIIVYQLSLHGNKSAMIRDYVKILEDEQPDVIHQFGTESVLATGLLGAVKQLNYQDRYIVSIQGIMGFISRQFGKDIPLAGLIRPTIIGSLKGTDIIPRKRKYIIQKTTEQEIIANARIVFGRTDIDKAFCYMVNCAENYRYCGETLRSSFYSGKWNAEKCELYSVFSSTNSGPIKGLHYLLEAIKILPPKYPYHLYLTGKDILKEKWYKLNNYELYIKKYIQKNELQSHITFLGSLTESEMRERMLKSHIIVISSAAENSSNFLGEAMMLGVPCIASDVGGAKHYVNHTVDGFCYEYDVPELLAFYISQLFDDQKLCEEISIHASEHARQKYGRESIESILSAYNELKRCE